MAEVKDVVSLTFYEDGTVESNSKNNKVTFEEAAWALGKIIGTAIPEYIGYEEGNEENFVARRSCAHNMIKNFCDGISGDPCALAWKNPKEELPVLTMRVLIGIERNGIRECISAFYNAQRKEFKKEDVEWEWDKNFLKPEEVLCWRPYPYPIKF